MCIKIICITGFQETKKDYCYMEYRSGQCSNPSNILITRSCCCCAANVGQIFGYGSPCTKCPEPGTSEFDQLCIHGNGRMPDGGGRFTNHLSPVYTKKRRRDSLLKYIISIRHQ